MTNAHMVPCIMLETGYGCIVLLCQRSLQEISSAMARTIHYCESHQQHCISYSK